MKKTLFLFLLPLHLFAVQVGNPCDPSFYPNGLIFEDCNPCSCYYFSEFSFRAGYVGDYIYNRYMQVKRTGSDVTSVNICTNAFYGIFNLWRRFDIFTTLGASNVVMQANTFTFNANFNDNKPFYINTDTSFSWSIGLKAAICTYCDYCFGIEGQYFYTNPDIRSSYDFATSGDISYPSGVSFKYSDWQIALGVTRGFCLGECMSVVPYASFIWEQALAKMDDAVIEPGPVVTLFDLEQAKQWGYALGMTLVRLEGWSVNLEGRFANQKALSFNTQFRF